MAQVEGSRRIAVVASGGAEVCLSLLGVQRAFEEAGIRPVSIAASGAAARIAASWRAGVNAREAARALRGWRRFLRAPDAKAEVFPAAAALAAQPPVELVVAVLGGELDGPARERMRALGSRVVIVDGYEGARAALAATSPPRPHVTPAAARRRERMGPVDAAWLRMETPDNPMTITSVMFFERAISHEALLEVAARSVDANARLRQRVVGGPTRWTWSSVGLVDLAAHVTRGRLPAGAGEVELRALVGRLGSTPLDRARPLWALHHVEGYRGGSAVISRLHHAIGDGAALMRLLMSLVGEAAPRYSTAAPGPVMRPEDLVRHKGEALRSLVRTLASPADVVTSLRPPLGPEKRMAWTRGVALDELREVAKRAGATTNDLVLAALAGALRRLLHERGERTHDVVLHAIVPVNLRPEERPGETAGGNRFGLVYAPLPLGIEDARARLAEVARATAEIKRSPEAAIALLTLSALGMMAPAVNERLTRWFGQKGTLVVTNVAGPKTKVALAGAGIEGMVFFAPQSARVGMGVSVLSYGGEVRVGIATDANVCAAPQAIVEMLEEELGGMMGRRQPTLTELRRRSTQTQFHQPQP